MLNILCNYDPFLVTCNVNPCGLLIVTCSKAGLPRVSTEEDTRDKYATLKSEYPSANELKGNRLYNKANLFLFSILQVSTVYRQTWASCWPYWLSPSKEQNPSWEANSHWSAPKISALLWKPKALKRGSKQPLICLYTKPDKTSLKPLTLVFKTLLNTILPSTSRSSKRFRVRFSDKR